MPPPTGRGSSGVDRRAGVQMALASAVSAAASYLVMMLGARLLPTVAESTLLLTFLAVLFAGNSVLSGLATETTRSVATTRRDGAAAGPPVWTLAAATALVFTALLGGTSVVWGDRVFSGHGVVLTTLVVLSAAGFTFHSALVGSLAGHAQWGLSSAAIATEGTVRMLLALVAGLLAATVVGFAAATAAGAAAWLLVAAASRRARSALGARMDLGYPDIGRRVAASIGAQASSAVLVLGFPLLLALSTPAAEYAAGAPLILAISVTRAPLLVPLNALQGLALAAFVHARTSPVRMLGLALALVAGVTAVGAVMASLIGPWVLTTLFGASFHVDATTLVLLVVAAGLLAALNLTGTFSQARGHHSWFLAGWLAATGTAVALLALPGTMEHRAVVSLLVAPAVGMVVHVRGMADVSDRARAHDS